MYSPESHGHLWGMISSEFAVFSNSAVSLYAASRLTCAKKAAWETSIRVACSDTMIRYLL